MELLQKLIYSKSLKKKLGIDFRNYKILGTCNPALAHKAIQLEDKIGIMLPCNIVVQEHENGEVEVSAINPLASIGAVQNDNLLSIANEVSEKFKTVIEKV